MLQERLDRLKVAFRSVRRRRRQRSEAGPVALVLFAGSAQLSRALQKLGCLAVASDFSEDVQQGSIKRYVNHVISTGAIDFVWLGAVRNRGRDSRAPCEQQQRSYAVFAASVLELCLQLRVPCGLEGPATANLWKSQEIAQLLQHDVARNHVCDVCQFGRFLRGRSRVVLWGCGEFPMLLRRCPSTVLRPTSLTSL